LLETRPSEYIMSDSKPIAIGLGGLLPYLRMDAEELTERIQAIRRR